MSASIVTRLAVMALAFSTSPSAGGHDLVEVAADQADLVLDALDQVLDAVGVLGRVVRQVADVGGHHHEALAELAGARGFDASR